MSKKVLIAIGVTIATLICICIIWAIHDENIELKTVSSEGQLYNIYNNNDEDSTVKEVFKNILSGPYLIIEGIFEKTKPSPKRNYYNDYIPPRSGNSSSSSSSGKYNPQEWTGSATEKASSSNSTSIFDKSTSSTKDYSTTNIQVENVDEADITKTDGNYIYSISDDSVIITNVVNPENVKVETTIKSTDGSIPEDLILYNDKLVVIATNSNLSSSYSYKENSNTIVKIYDITNKYRPNMVKSFELYEPYYTSRCINNQLYIISSGGLRINDDKVVRTYKENREEEQLPLNKIKYLKDVRTDKQTLIALQDLDNPKNEIDLTSYLIDISNAYVSENGIYLLDEKYDSLTGSTTGQIISLFGLKGLFGINDYSEIDYKRFLSTEIYKFDIAKEGTINYRSKTKVNGQTINQYSLDEQNGHLRVALYDSNGARVVIFNEKLEKIGASSNLAKGEKMYSTRFIGDKAYLVTYKTIDPLFVIDLSNETKPKVLGELKIPGYSTYLHPYDENHLIGIGMQTEETVNKNSSGRVISTTARITGMKMALFDISDVENPEQISETVIGDRRTTSAILTNPKALLFSKEKQLIAIPVNNYEEDFEVSSSDETYSSVVDAYKNYNKSRVAEGFFVYKINTDEGFKLKGVITHEAKQNNTTKNYYYTTTKLLRGMYINNNLYTVSENELKVNNLETLELIKELRFK